MKILIAHYKYYLQGGPERYMFKFMELARKNGAEVIPFSVHYPTNEKTEYSSFFVGDENAGGNYDANNKHLSYLAKGAWHEFHNREAFRNIKALIRQTKPDVLYVLIPGQLTPDIFQAAKEERVPVILRISDFRLICGKNLLMRDGKICLDCMHGDYRPMIQNRCVKGSKALSTLRAASCCYQRKRYDAVDAVITPPESTKKLLVESGFFPEEKVYVNPTFIDCSGIEPSCDSQNYVLCLGRFSEEKGFQYAVEAMGFLKDIPVTLTITGTKENCPPELLARMENLGIADQIRFAGFLKGKELEDLTKNALCVACPAVWYENLPNVVLESYAYGKPVIASNLGSLADAVEDGRSGLLFEPGNPEQIARCIRFLYENPEKRVEMGRYARKLCEEKYAPQAHWQRFLEIARKVGVKD